MTFVATLTFLVLPMASDPTAPHAHGEHGHAAAAAHAQSADHDHAADHAHDNHGNPADFDAYVARMEEPERAAWQKPDEVVKALGLAPGARICEIGPGPGYFTLRLARAVGPDGLIYAVDVEPRMLAVLADRLGKSGTRNVLPVLGLPDDPLVPAAACDLVLIVDVLHHLPDPVAYLTRLGRSLAKGGRIVDIDFQKRETPVGPPPEMRIARDDAVTLAGKAGLTVSAERDFLPYQYFLELRRK